MTGARYAVASVAIIILSHLAHYWLLHYQDSAEEELDWLKDDQGIYRFAHPLWTPPTLCNSLESQKQLSLPALNFYPPVLVEYPRWILQIQAPPVPEGWWMLDAPAIISTIRKQTEFSLWLVNLGANPTSLGENGERRVVRGDDCSPMWPMGYSGVNFDIPSNEKTMRAYYGKWPKAIVDLNMTAPMGIATSLQLYGVPKDMDFLKIDVDSFDCDYLSEILTAGYRPKAINIELAAPWPPPLKFRMRYTEGFAYEASSGTMLSGCSLQAGAEVAKPFGYSLLQYAMEDGWFVQNEYLGLFGPVESDIIKAYDVGNPNLYAPWAWLGDENILHELKDLRSDPARMLEKAKDGVRQVVAGRPALQKAKYTLEV